MALPTAQITHGGGVTDALTELDETSWVQDGKGFWTGAVKYFVKSATNLRTGPLERGQVHGTHTKMFVTGINWKSEGDGDYTASASYKGFIGTSPPGYFREDISSGRFTTTGSAISGIPGAAGAVKAEVADRNIGVRDSYISLTEPDFADIGTTQTPPDAPTTPAFLWASLADAIVIYPSGWVLEDRKSNPLVAEDGTRLLWYVTDTYGYHHALKPGDI